MNAPISPALPASGQTMVAGASWLRWAVIALALLSVTAYLSSLVLPNFEFCYLGCRTMAGYEYQFAPLSGAGVLAGAAIVAQASYWIGVAMLLRGLPWWWVLIALVPHAAWWGYFGFTVFAYLNVFVQLFAGWWLWISAGPLLVSAILIHRRRVSAVPS